MILISCQKIAAYKSEQCIFVEKKRKSLNDIWNKNLSFNTNKNSSIDRKNNFKGRFLLGRTF